LFDRLDVFMLEFEQQDKETEAAVASVGEASAYALTWEWGNVRQVERGPKTTMGLNPAGQRVFLSIQAPFGYIRINQGRYWEILQEEVQKVRFESERTGDISDELRSAARRAVRRCAQLIRETVPVDSGALQRSIQVIDPEDYAALGLGEPLDRRETFYLTEA